MSRALARAARCEWSRLVSLRLTWTVIALCVLAAAGNAALLALPMASGPPRAGVAGVDVPRLLAARAPYLPLPPAGLGAAVLGVFAFAQEFRRRTILTTFTAVPCRTLVLVAKALVVSALATVIVGLQFVAAFAAMTLTLSQRMGERWQPVGHPGAALLGALATAILGALIGLAVAGLARRLALTLTILVVLTAAAGTPLGLLARQARLGPIRQTLRYLPFQAASDLTPAGFCRPSCVGVGAPPHPWQGALALAAFAAGLLTLCWAALLRRDP